MHTRFARGLIIGSIIGASVGMMLGPDIMNHRTKKRMMRAGRNWLRRSGSLVNDLFHVFR